MGPAAQRVYAEIERAKTRLNVVYQEALVNLAREMQRPITEGGNMPIRSGFLQSTLEVRVDGSIPGLVEHPGGTGYSWDASATNRLLRTATIRKHRATLTYTAKYAQFAEYRHRFTALAVQRWPALVAESASKIGAT